MRLEKVYFKPTGWTLKGKELLCGNSEAIKLYLMHETLEAFLAGVIFYSLMFELAVKRLITFLFLSFKIGSREYAWDTTFKMFSTHQRLNVECPNNKIYDHSRSVSLCLNAALVRIQLYLYSVVWPYIFTFSLSFFSYLRKKSNEKSPSFYKEASLQKNTVCCTLQTRKPSNLPLILNSVWKHNPHFKFGSLQSSFSVPKVLGISSNRFYVTEAGTTLSTQPGSQISETAMINSYWWFVGFSDGEGCFNIIPKKDKQGNLRSFEFVFVIGLHKDDLDVLTKLQSTLSLGRVTLHKTKCTFVVNRQEDIKKLISIFDHYNLNTTKYLDFMVFKKAFNLYIQRDGSLTQQLIDELFTLKNEINTSRIDFKMPSNHEIKINRYWLLGQIEGEGSFYLDRARILPEFAIRLTAVQLPVLEKIKEYLISNLGFDAYSILKLKSSSVININQQKSINKSKPTVILSINNIHVLNNFFIPLLSELDFMSKKGKDFEDFKLICKVVYCGADLRPETKALILKLSRTMNDYRLSSNINPVELLTVEEKEALNMAPSALEQLPDGRQRDISLNKIIYLHSTCLYEIINLATGEVSIEQTLTASAETIGVTYRTLTKYMKIEEENKIVEVKGCRIKRIGVFLEKVNK